MEQDVPEQPSGLDRRSLLKRSAVVGGALVWTAPVVQSVASPAFATGSGTPGGTCPPGSRYFLKIDANGAKDNAVGGNADCGISGGSAPAPGGVLSAVSASFTSQTATITVPAGYAIATGSAKAGQACGGTLTKTGPTTYTLGSPTRQAISNIQLVLVCA